MRKISIVHYLPVSFYPPTMNLVNTLENSVNIEILTTNTDKGNINYRPQRAKIFTPVTINKKNSVLRLMDYLWFVIFSLVRFIFTKPDYILYYESISAYPVYLYKKYINCNVRVFVHYHEYSSEEQYQGPGRKLFKINHDIERKWLYQHCDWISQTNAHRLNMFLEDNSMIDRSKAHVFPNYPPKSWLKKNRRHGGNVVKCVYVGSLSMKDTFVMEFCKWVISQKGRVTFDIYSYNFHGDTFQAITELKSDYINFHNMGLRYYEIPMFLDGYDVGLLLYKANSINFQWNETNKFYEYLICGLDVWYPKEMLLLHEIDKSQFAPQIKEMDLGNMDAFNGFVKAGFVDNSTYHWFAEDVYNDFLHDKIV